jgi:hypothetical protein
MEPFTLTVKISALPSFWMTSTSVSLQLSSLCPPPHAHQLLHLSSRYRFSVLDHRSKVDKSSMGWTSTRACLPSCEKPRCGVRGRRVWGPSSPLLLVGSHFYAKLRMVASFGNMGEVDPRPSALESITYLLCCFSHGLCMKDNHPTVAHLLLAAGMPSPGSDAQWPGHCT